ncbi:L,D-transpeptidase family protein [Streptomyces sp. 3MP-14]|uniref:L,D-transpeptidase family protein n=1 Tax=Streptomyces mimosae TaxID=2586635 RepID=A0A5N6ACL9_9ACTN|nr:MULTISPECIES: Ig-like domain-containing protein [Streptomyces]KAB8165258.1 L,D-transpeptidase family protein [Streptomyces mimosae]KAB8175890.1 L,D-transpeptidase family protein [Streptomyces sp. 3MP-14]
MVDVMRRRGLTAAAALLCGVLALTSCGGGGDDSDGAEQTEQSEADQAAEDANTSSAVISITPEDAAEGVGINDDVAVAVEDGTLDEVVLTATEAGTEVPGTVSEDQTSWQPDEQLDRATRYELSVQASDAEGREAHQVATFTTIAPENSFIGYFTPEDGAEVGVGMPVSLNFDQEITNRAAVQQAVTVTASSGQEVVGHWFDGTRLDFRPESYWEAGTTVNVSLDFDGVEGAPGISGVQDRDFSFTVGRAQISTVDVEAKQMEVVRDGEPLRTVPISAGSEENPTYNGQMVISEKYEETRMDGATVGFTDDDGEGEYDIPDVPHAMRLSTSGTFVHGNYWAPDSTFGSANTSHGCVGLNDEQGADDPDQDGAWFFEESLIGDVVVVINSPDELITPENGLNGWNMSWDDWVAGSAI